MSAVNEARAGAINVVPDAGAAKSEHVPFWQRRAFYR
jgi:hypothetical protein